VFAKDIQDCLKGSIHPGNLCIVVAHELQSENQGLFRSFV